MKELEYFDFGPLHIAVVRENRISGGSFLFLGLRLRSKTAYNHWVSLLDFLILGSEIRNAGKLFEAPYPELEIPNWAKKEDVLKALDGLREKIYTKYPGLLKEGKLDSL